jgi:hypothetical protein
MQCLVNKLKRVQARELAYEMIVEYLSTFTDISMGYSSDIYGRLQPDYDNEYNYNLVDSAVQVILNRIKTRYREVENQAESYWYSN